MLKMRSTDDPHVHYMEADAVALWCHGVVEWKINTHDRKFVLTAIMRDHSEGFVVDATESFERFMREKERRQ